VNQAPSALAGRITEVRQRIADAERRSGRPAGSTTLVGVVKTLPAEVIAEAVGLGLADLGENRVQEAEFHQRHVPRNAARWHMIGHLQRNKASKALELFDRIHGVDDAALGESLSRRAFLLGRRVQVLAEVNVSGEASKFGAAPEAVPALVEALAALPGLELVGLMTVGAPVEDAQHARPGFVRLRGLRDAAERQLGRGLPELSMGMSGDFEVAIEEGATMVRVGSAIFGART
jgi:hypothetical protein